MNNNVFEKGISFLASGSEAWKMGDEFFNATLKQDYKRLSKENIVNFLKKAVSLQKEDGLIYIYQDSTMPRDARVGIVYQPCYAVIALGVYTKNIFPEIWDDELNTFLKKLMDGTFKKGIVGHGIDSSKTIRETMMMLCLAGVKAFLEREPEFSREFTDTVNRYILNFQEITEQLESEGKLFYDSGFETIPCNAYLKHILSAWKGNFNGVFVYGTLMKGQRAERLLKNTDYCGRFYLENYAMYDLGSYPGIRPSKGDSVLGEVYFVSDEILSSLDRYEGEGVLYNRETVKVNNPYGDLIVQVYVYGNEINGKILSEPWNKKDEDKVWYAAYGSNLSAERFQCYVKGGQCKQNGKNYTGCRNKSLWSESVCCNYQGKIYFGNQSGSWNGMGVAFYDRNSYGKTYMRLYKITREQLHDIQVQEGLSAHWYGKLICLGIYRDGCPVYTFSSVERHEETQPDICYVELIRNALIDECGYSEKEVDEYLNSALKKRKS